MLVKLTLGIVGLVIGLAETQQLHLRELETKNEQNGSDLDMSLLRLTSIFFFLYNIFTIITGSFNMHIKHFPNWLNIVNGSVSILEICMQIAFIHNLKSKVHSGCCSIRFFWIVNPIQIHRKYVIVNPNPNPLFKMD
jgi:hypothetical protein